MWPRDQSRTYRMNANRSSFNSEMNTQDNWWHMFGANVYLTTTVEAVNLQNDEIKSVLVVLMASYFLNNVTCTVWGYVSLRILHLHQVIF